MNESIIDPKNTEEWLCACGNRAEQSGFDPCTEHGVLCEPDAMWNAFYLCGNCGRVINHDGLVCADASESRLSAALDCINSGGPKASKAPAVRAEAIAEKAVEAFWAEVARLCPDVKTGDFPPGVDDNFNQVAVSMVRTWLSANSIPAEVDEAMLTQRVVLLNENQVCESTTTLREFFAANPEFDATTQERIAHALNTAGSYSMNMGAGGCFHLHLAAPTPETLRVLPVAHTPEEELVRVTGMGHSDFAAVDTIIECGWRDRSGYYECTGGKFSATVLAESVESENEEYVRWFVWKEVFGL